MVQVVTGANTGAVSVGGKLEEAFKSEQQTFVYTQSAPEGVSSEGIRKIPNQGNEEHLNL